MMFALAIMVGAVLFYFVLSDPAVLAESKSPGAWAGWILFVCLILLLVLR